MLSAIKTYIPFQPTARVLTRLHGHTAPVVSLAISASGKLLASGGIDGLRIWDITMKTEMAAPQRPSDESLHVSCVAWITWKNEVFETLCYGNALGFLVFIRQCPAEGTFEAIHCARIGQGGEIVSLAVDTSTTQYTRIATGTRDRCVQIWSFDPSARKLIPIHSKQYGSNIIPKALSFLGNDNSDLLIFGLYDGGLYGADSGKWVSSFQLGSRVGNADVNLENDLCVVDNVGNGFDIYRITSGHFVRNLSTREPTKTYPKGVAFANHSQAVIGGSDHGCVYIFDHKSGDLVETLKHAEGGGAQTIAIYDRADSVIIASACGSTISTCPITVWEWNPGRKHRSNPKLYKASSLRMLLILALTVIGFAYFWGIIRGHSIFHPHTESKYSEQDIREVVRQELVAEMKVVWGTLSDNKGCY